MDKYSEVQTAVEGLKSTVEMPLGTVKNYASGYTMDTIVYKKDSLIFPKEIDEIIQEEGSIGLIEGVSSVWASVYGRLVIWDYKTRMINEIEIKLQKACAIFAITPGSGIFTPNVQHCILLFTDKSISILCLCKAPVGYVSMDISVDLPVPMTCVCETGEGRVFMGGSDGHIYEFVYKERSWLKGYRAKIVSHTRGVIEHVFPFRYALRNRPGIKQIITTYKGLLVLFEDNTLEAYEVKKGLNKMQTVRHPGLASQKNIQLVRVDGRVHQGYLIIPNGTRIFLDCLGNALGERGMPSTRLRSRIGVGSTIEDKLFYQTGGNLVSIGKKENDGILTVISPNILDSMLPENCSTIKTGEEYREIGVSKGKHWENQAERIIMGEEVALLGASKVDIYHIMNGAEVMERASTNPEGIFAFIQRNGKEKALVSALYAISEGISSLAIDNLFKKAEELQKKAISGCAGIFVYKIWSIDIYTILKEETGISVSEYVSEIDMAIERTRKLRSFVIKECKNIRSIQIAGETVIDMLDNIIETLYYVNILMESDTVYIFEEARKNSSIELAFTFRNFLVPVSEIRTATLNALVDLNLSQKASIDGITTYLNEKCATIFALTDTLLLKGKEAVEKASRATAEEDRKWYLVKSMEFFTKTPAKKYLSEIVELYAGVRFSKGILCAVCSGFNSITEDQAFEYFRKIEYTEEIIQEGLKDERPSLCNALLKSVIEKIQNKEFSADLLLKIRSPILEDYLFRLNMASETVDLCDLIWKYHIKHKNYYTASLHLIQLAERVIPVITLQKRIEYLSIASTMQMASQKDGGTPVAQGPIKDYSSQLGIDAKERFRMVQIQAEVMASLSCMHRDKPESSDERSILDKTYMKLDNNLLGLEELFEICVMFGFSTLALKIGAKGEIEDRHLLRELWEDALSGSYINNISILKDNPDISKGAPLELIFDILLQKKIESPNEGNNIGEDLVSIGGSIMKVANMLNNKAMGTDYPTPRDKKIVLEEATHFCEFHNLTELAHKMTSFKMSLGI